MAPKKKKVRKSPTPRATPPQENPPTAVELPEFVDGLTRLADLLQAHYKIPCSKQLVKRWQKQVPYFPSPTTANRYRVKDCQDWVEQYVLPKRDASAGEASLLHKALEAETRIKIAKARTAEVEADDAEDKFIERGKSEQTSMAVAVGYHALVKRLIEKNLPDQRRDELRRLGVSDVVLQQFYAFDLAQTQRLVASIEEACETLSRPPKEEADEPE